MRPSERCGRIAEAGGECSFIYRYILRESCSQFDSLPLTSSTISPAKVELGDGECALAASEVLRELRSSSGSTAPLLGLSSLLTTPPRVQTDSGDRGPRAPLGSPRGESRGRASSIESFKVRSTLFETRARPMRACSAQHTPP